MAIADDFAAAAPRKAEGGFRLEPFPQGARLEWHRCHYGQKVAGTVATIERRQRSDAAPGELSGTEFASRIQSLGVATRSAPTGLRGYDRNPTPRFSSHNPSAANAATNPSINA